MRVNSTVSVTVMSHPRRKAQAELLVEQLRREGLLATICYDPDPEAPPSAMRSSAVAWGSFKIDVSHHAVLQDDVSLPIGFQRALMSAIDARPSHVIALTTDWTTRTGAACRQAAIHGYAWTRLYESRIWPPAVIMPTRLAEKFSNFATGYPGDRDSQALHQFAIDNGLDACTPVPNLVQHDVPPSNSLWPRTISQGLRRAALYLNDVRTVNYDSPRTFDQDCLAYIPLESLRSRIFRFSSQGDVDTGSTEWLAKKLGWTEPSVQSLVLAALDRLRTDSSYVRTMARSHLYELWLTCFANGVIGGLGYERASTSLVEAGMRSLVSGSLKRTLSPGRIDALRHGDGVAWLLDALDLGASYHEVLE